jgi:predicted glycoside hydrolase/deacetylase ChbG (UPF0249 family)
LVVNADDFGRSAGINRGIIRAHEHGLVTSASLMVRWPAAREAAAYARRHPALGVGLHFDFGEWTCREGTWVALYDVVQLDDQVDLKQEAHHQLARFRHLVGANPTHLDSHQHVHRREPARSVLTEIARDLDVPLRHECKVRYCGEFYGQDADGSPIPGSLTPTHLVGLLSRLPRGVTELCCHPGEEEELDTMYCRERVEEVRTLCNPEVSEAVGRLAIKLTSFASVSPAGEENSQHLEKSDRGAP